MPLKRLCKLPNSSLLMIRQILKQWKKEYGKEFPNDYLCFDMETTGFDIDDDLIVEVGNCRVKDGSATFYESQVLDWTKSDYVDNEWLEFKLWKCQEQMARAGRQSHMTIERMKREGEQPEEVLQNYADMLTEATDAGEFIVGHNIVGFDAPRFSQAVREWLGVDFSFATNGILDTAAIEKASQIGTLPYRDETMSEYFKRVMSLRAQGIRSNLDVHCVNKYQLCEKYGLDMGGAHTAGFDAMLVHLLLEEFRELSKS